MDVATTGGETLGGGVLSGAGGDWDEHDVDFLAAWIAGDNEHGSGDSGDSPPAPPAAVPRDRNPTRERQRRELTYLRSRVEDMERELAALRSRKPQVNAVTAVDSEWHAIAVRQQQAREKAEVENAKLRGLLESQVRLARTLERLLRKRDHDVLALDSRGNKKRRAAIDASVSDQSDSAVFERLLLSIDRSYAETAAVLTANGLRTAPRGHRRVDIKHARRDAEPTSGVTPHELYVEMTDVTTVPFAMESAARAAWRCITGGFMQLDHEVYQELAGQDNVLAIKYAITLSRRRLHIDFTARATMKRFVERDRIVDVWESISDTAGGHTLPRGTHGIRVRERGWTVFSSVDGDPTRTLQLTCMQMMPLVSFGNNTDPAKSDEDRQVGLLTNLALDYYGDQLDLAQHAMETLLLDEARDVAAIARPLPRA